MRGARALLEREGIFAGVSSGAAVHVARKIAEEMDEGVIVTILTDAGWKYVSADFWEASDERRRRVHGAHDLVVIPAAVRAALVAHATAELPNEACGLVVLQDDVAVEYIPGRNASPSPYHFELEIDPLVWADLNDRDGAQAVFHSHVSSPPRPSRTDVENIGLWAGQPYLIYTVRTDELAAWRIVDGRDRGAAADVALKPTRAALRPPCRDARGARSCYLTVNEPFMKGAGRRRTCTCPSSGSR